MNAFDLQRAFNFRYDSQQRYDLIVPNVHVGAHEWDLLAVRRSGYIDEIEIKVTKSDFNADFKKQGQKRVPVPSSASPESYWTHWKLAWFKKHRLTADGDRKCNYFYFMLPTSLADKCEIPEHAGLFVCHDGKTGIRISEAKRAGLLHKNKVDQNFLYKVAKKASYRYWDAVRRSNEDHK